MGQWLRRVPALGGECEVGGEWLLRRVLSNKRAAVNTELLSIHRETKTVFWSSQELHSAFAREIEGVHHRCRSDREVMGVWLVVVLAGSFLRRAWTLSSMILLSFSCSAASASCTATATATAVTVESAVWRS